MFGVRTRREIRRLRHLLHTPRVDRSTRRIDHTIMPILDSSARRTAQARNINHHAVLYALEANKSTCCISIANEKQKSRASIVLFRGRILMCVFGRRGMPYHIQGSDAFHNTRLALSNPQSQVTAHALSEGLALAVCSVFLGEKKEQAVSQEFGTFVATMTKQINDSKAPGCIVFKDSSRQTHCILYLHNGEIAGFYSFQDGWILKKIDQHLARVIAKAQNLQAEAFTFKISSLEALYDWTISLSGSESSPTDKFHWLTSIACEEAMAPLDRHTQEPALKDTFKVDDHSFAYKRDIARVVGYSLRNSGVPHSHFVNPGHSAAHIASTSFVD